MDIGNRLRSLREARTLSQGDIEKQTGLLRCYVSRVENGHTVPSIETLEKWAQALGIEMYQLFYDGNTPRPVKASVPINLGGGRELAELYRDLSPDRKSLLLKLARLFRK